MFLMWDDDANAMTSGGMLFYTQFANAEEIFPRNLLQDAGGNYGKFLMEDFEIFFKSNKFKFDASQHTRFNFDDNIFHLNSH